MPDFLISIIVQIALGLLNRYAAPKVIEAKEKLEKDHPGMTGLVEGVLGFLSTVHSQGESAKPSAPLQQAAATFKKECEGIACESDLKRD